MQLDSSESTQVAWHALGCASSIFHAIPLCSPNYPRASRSGWTHARHRPFLNLRFDHRCLSGWLDLFQRILLQESIFMCFVEWWLRDMHCTRSESSQYPQPGRKCLRPKSTRRRKFMVGPLWYQLWRDICVERWNTFWLSLLGETPTKQLPQWGLCSHARVPSRSQVWMERY